VSDVIVFDISTHHRNEADYSFITHKLSV